MAQPNVRRYEPSMRALGMPEHRAPRVTYRITRLNPENPTEAALRAGMLADAKVHRQRNRASPDTSPSGLAAKAQRNRQRNELRARRAREAIL